MKPKTVKIYDFDTKKITEIPESELAPGMIIADVHGVGRVWIKASQVNDEPGEYRHPPFSDDLRKLMVESIIEPLREVHPLSIEQWEKGFRMDLNAEREIATWIHMARTFSEAIKRKGFSRTQRQEIFNIVVACSSCPRDSVLTVVQLSAISRNQAKTVIDLYFGERP